MFTYTTVQKFGVGKIFFYCFRNTEAAFICKNKIAQP